MEVYKLSGNKNYNKKFLLVPGLMSLGYENSCHISRQLVDEWG